VVIPAYNAEETIARTISSVRACNVDEVIVVDDGSNDKTAQVALDHGCQVLRQQNMGAGMARFRGFSESRSRFVTFIDADDELIPAGIAVLRDWAFSHDSDWAAVAGRVAVPGRRRDSELRQYSPVTLRTLIRRGFSPFPPAAALWNSEILRMLSRTDFGAMYRYAEDYCLLVSAAAQADIVQLKVRSCRYYPLAGKSALRPERSFECMEQIRTRASQRHGIPYRRARESEVSNRIVIRRRTIEYRQGSLGDKLRLLPSISTRIVYRGLLGALPRRSHVGIRD
jgi:glycosyltransferase involved in cell wall biosynthesis